MEEHEQSAPGAPEGDEWREVAQRFRRLSERFREHYRGREQDGGDGERLEDALRSVVAEVDRALTAVGDTGRDPRFRAEAREAALRLGDAIAATFDEVGEAVRQRFGRSGG